jgi:hypothetical protein
MKKTKNIAMGNVICAVVRIQEKTRKWLYIKLLIIRVKTKKIVQLKNNKEYFFILLCTAGALRGGAPRIGGSVRLAQG